MGKLTVLTVSFLILTACFGCASQLAPMPDNPDPEQILKSLVPEIQNIKMVTGKDLEPNPQGKYRRHAFIREDFNRDGKEDIGICATDEWARGRNAYVLIASKREDGTWVRTFFHKFPGIAYPFLIWDSERGALLVGANQSDSNPGDIVWDRTTKRYKVVKSKE